MLSQVHDICLNLKRKRKNGKQEIALLWQSGIAREIEKANRNMTRPQISNQSFTLKRSCLNSLLSKYRGCCLSPPWLTADDVLSWRRMNANSFTSSRRQQQMMYHEMQWETKDLFNLWTLDSLNYHSLFDFSLWDNFLVSALNILACSPLVTSRTHRAIGTISFKSRTSSYWKKKRMSTQFWTRA